VAFAGWGRGVTAEYTDARVGIQTQYQQITNKQYMYTQHILSSWSCGDNLLNSLEVSSVMACRCLCEQAKDKLK